MLLPPVHPSKNLRLHLLQPPKHHPLHLRALHSNNNNQNHKNRGNKDQNSRSKHHTNQPMRKPWRRISSLSSLVHQI